VKLMPLRRAGNSEVDEGRDNDRQDDHDEVLEHAQTPATLGRNGGRKTKHSGTVAKISEDGLGRSPTKGAALSDTPNTPLMEQARAERYALAGALSVTVADLLQQLHRVAGAPVIDTHSLAPQRRLAAVAATKSRAAAAACSAIVARLLICERDASRVDLPDVGRPAFIEPAVTTLEGLPSYVCQASLRAINATRAELTSAVEQWQGWEGSAAADVEKVLRKLLGYVDRLGELFEQEAEPSGVNGVARPAPLRRVTATDDRASAAEPA
jgi:hypothetical protein